VTYYVIYDSSHPFISTFAGMSIFYILRNQDRLKEPSPNKNLETAQKFWEKLEVKVK